MTGIKVRQAAAAVVLAMLGAAAAFAATANSEPAAAAAAYAGPASPATGAGEVAGTVTTRVVIKRFTAIGRRVVGKGLAVSTLRDRDGVVTSTTQKTFRITLRTGQRRLQQAAESCQILFLELEELDLTLLGLRVFLRSATTGDPIRLKLSAIRENGVLGRLFCDLAQSTITTAAKAQQATTQLNRRLSDTKILQAKATVYAPRALRSGGNSVQAPQQAGLCEVLHLVLGPLHLDLLGLVVDLNKIALDLWAIPGTTLGDLFCSVVGGPSTTTTATTTTATTTAPTTTVP